MGDSANVVTISGDELKQADLINALKPFDSEASFVETWQIRGDMYVGKKDAFTLGREVVHATTGMPMGVGVCGLDKAGRILVVLLSTANIIYIHAPFDISASVMKLMDEGKLDAELDRISKLKAKRDQMIENYTS